MSVKASLFPKSLRVARLADAHWPVMVKDTEGSTIFLTEEQADDLAALLWNRRIEQEQPL